MWLLYQLALSAAVLLGGPLLLWKRGRHYLDSLPRLGRYPGEPPAESRRPLWIHAVSVGEVGVAATVIAALPAQVPLLVTTITPTGQARARALFAGRADVAYLPLDLGFPVRQFFRRFAPRALLLVEGDHWPLLLRETRRRRLPVAVLNGRVSDRSFPRLLRFRRFLAPLYEPVSLFGVQSDLDRERLLAIGVPAERITVTGNLKYEAPAAKPRLDLAERLRRLAGERAILLAGSTMPAEEEQVIEAFRASGGPARSLLVVAPRHPERFDGVAALLAGSFPRVVRRSDLPLAGTPDVVLLDSVGELAGLYQCASAAFVGGTLVSSGGHNPLEPAQAGVPVAVGPSMENFRDMAEQFDRAAAWRRVEDAEELGAVWREWLDNPEAAHGQSARAAALLESNRGALSRTQELLRPILRQFSSPQ
jgi:3-deoxy-D-manno-octulosonic-acid transferase